MSLKLKIGFWSIVVAQLLLLAFIGVKQYTLWAGTNVVLQTVPVDPRSILQGDYAILRYEISTLPRHLDYLPSGSTVYVTLLERGEVWEAGYYTTQHPSSGKVFIRGTLGRSSELDFGIGTYFMPEGTGHIIERAGDVKVRVSVDGDGRAVIKEVLVDGEPFHPDMARASGLDAPGDEQRPDPPSPVP